MAGEVRFKTHWHMVVEAGKTYTIADFPTIPDATIDTIELKEAGFLTGVALNSDGTRVVDSKGDYEPALTTMRGIRMRIDVPGALASSTGNASNVPGAILVGEQIVFDADFKYVCTEGAGILALGVKEV